MNPDQKKRLSELFTAHAADSLTPEEHAELQTHLRNDAESRRWWFVHQDVEIGLRAQVAAEQLTAPKARLALPWLSWRPLTAAAAGIVFGMFCTSVVFGYVMPRAVATTSRLFALVDGSFERQSGRVASGFPSEFGKWSGDEAEVAAGEAKDGKQALRFVRAEGDPAVPNSAASACDVFQLVDLRGVNVDRQGEDAMLELSVAFRDARTAKGPPVRFDCRVFVFTGDPSGVRDEWPLTMRDALAGGAGSASSSGGAPQPWQVVTTKTVLPAKAEFAVVQIVATKAVPRGQVAEFSEQFADDVRLTLKTQPTLPERLARR